VHEVLWKMQIKGGPEQGGQMSLVEKSAKL
jgi:hypothetical protein